MDYKTTLKHLEKLGEVNFEEFAKATKIPKHNASVYLSRLFKMGLAKRRKDIRYNNKEYHRKPYLYKTSEKKGKQYLTYEETTKTSLKKHYEEELKREINYLDVLKIHKEIRDLEEKLAEPTPKTEEKITHITKEGHILHLTSAEFLEMKKHEEETEEKHRKQEAEDRTQHEYEQKNQEEKDLVEWEIGEGNNTRIIKVRPETIPLLIQAQSKKDEKSEKAKALQEHLKKQDDRSQQFQTQMSNMQKKVKELKAQMARDPLSRLIEQKDKMERLGIIQPSEDKQTHHEYGLKDIKMFDRENRKGPVKNVLLPQNTNLRPMNMFNTMFTNKHVMTKDGTWRSELTYPGTLFPRPIRNLLGRLF